MHAAEQVQARDSMSTRKRNCREAALHADRAYYASERGQRIAHIDALEHEAQKRHKSTADTEYWLCERVLRAYREWLTREGVPLDDAWSRLDREQRFIAVTHMTLRGVRLHFEQLFVHGERWQDYANRWEMDHRRPLNAFDAHQPEDRLLAWRHDNLRPVTRAENQSKSDRLEAPHAPSVPIVSLCSTVAARADDDDDDIVTRMNGARDVPRETRALADRVALAAGIACGSTETCAALAQFLLQRVDWHERHMVRTAVFRRAFDTWCAQSAPPSCPSIKRGVFAQMMRAVLQRHYAPTHAWRRKTHGGQYFYCGVRLAPRV